MDKIMTQFETVKYLDLVPNLEDAQEFVGGYVETIRVPNGDTLLVNEDAGLMRTFSVNHEATAYIHDKTDWGMLLLGNVMLLPKSLNQKEW